MATTAQDVPEPVLRLPDDPSLDQLRNQARELQRGVRAGRSTAIDLVAAALPGGLPLADGQAFRLSTAQLAVARAYGFSSWPKLRAHLDVIARWRWDPVPEPPNAPGGDVHDRFLDLACLRYDHDDKPARRARARAVLAAHPRLPEQSIWAAAVASDPAALGAHLAADPSSGVRSGGPLGWEPLMYLTYSRLDPGVDRDAVLECARLLLAAGGDPDGGRLWRGLTTPFTLLTGCFGEGENGPVNQPRHPQSIALARLFLDAGADPDDGQALYNRMFGSDDDHLELLFAHGLGANRPGLARPWRARLGAALGTVEQMVDRQLAYAIRHGFSRRVALLLAHGVDPSRPLPGGGLAIAVAARTGQREIVELLRAAGAKPARLGRKAAFRAAVLAADRSAVARLEGADPTVAAELRETRPDLITVAVEGRRLDALPLLTELGFDVDFRAGDSGTALHHAAWAGDVEAVRALFALGADPTVRDGHYDSTPAGWAEHAGQQETRELLADAESRAVR
jgi:ankyrin repeat protein